ncbi:uncharacterized protein LOC111323016 isoform X1 [Stylophora pistillata]|uniref:uncharacterized protein LOC111323016 isoform X1 n=1 Tax=Stylophora pistillata TaxID=50429 RepID=UPI000C046082|nr:uncharacterized protein LOC111323016 isoform X1 [Stylophora pistillata]XP_022782012.1 uncharacterized protein LOC111323016 isoform X1 [Stylophora pistillata]XP_022782013.1 uncharacterized protein LOC111323016 isoform X1 [Stylophora pistillata]XP_022782014.1 uncharacterized protein LOC111323016 isoform X1 [Stylophora pistillata]XP_022782015.1 uncharacterized protein LOC111323016 isoform X1 [Stylophora pistillata]XP_022782016.1 uncharacterized protein LOC111323016 isoform X1 [Stylophora pisti
MANADRIVHVQNGFMDSHFDDMASILCQFQIQDLEITADTRNTHTRMLEYNSHGNLQAIHGNMPSNHGNMLEIYGNMQAIQGNMQAINGNVHPIHDNIQAIHGNMQAIHVNDDWQVNLLDRMIQWICQDQMNTKLNS